MSQVDRSNYKDDKPHLFLPIVIWIVAGFFAWNYINPQSFWGGILFIIVWVILGNVVQFLIGSLVAIVINSSERRPKLKRVSFDFEKYRKTNYETAMLLAITHYNNADIDESANYIAGYAYNLIEKGDKDLAYKVLNGYMSDHALKKFGMEEFAKNIDRVAISSIEEKENFNELIQIINNISNLLKRQK